MDRNLLKPSNPRQLEILKTRRLELRNLLAAVGLASNLAQGSLVEVNGHNKILRCVDSSLEHMLADPEYVGGHEFTLKKPQ